MRTEIDLPWLAGPLQALRDEQRGHALILHGGQGSGLLELSLRLAQAWLCEHPPGPCDRCPSCHLALAHTHPDLRVVMPETWQQQLQWTAAEGGDEAGGDGESRSKRKPSREIKVEAVRQAIDWAHTSSGRNRGKVLLFFPADAMNTVSANALLKTLEEPGQGMRILLAVRDPEHLLPTIRSRCQRARLSPPPAEQALQWLRQQPQLAGAEVLLQAAGGEPLAALDLATQGISAEVWLSLPQQLAHGDARLLASWPLPQALRVLQQLCHDLMAQAAGGEPRYFPRQSLPARPASWADLSAWQQELWRVSRHDEHPWNAGLLLEGLMARGRALLANQATAPSRPARPLHSKP